MIEEVAAKSGGHLESYARPPSSFPLKRLQDGVIFMRAQMVTRPIKDFYGGQSPLEFSRSDVQILHSQ